MKKKEKKWFVRMLIISLAMLALWMLQLTPLHPLFENSARTLLLGSSAILVVLFFLFVRKILIYYTPTRFLKYLINNHDKHPKINNYKSFRSLSDLTYYSVRNQNESLGISLSEFMYKAFKQVREEQITNAVQYPAAYYEFVVKCIEECLVTNNTRLRFLEHRTSGSVWLLGEFERHHISDLTYNWIWRNILISVKHNKDENIMDHWETAHQHFIYSIPPLDKLHDKEFQVSNQKDIDARELERKRFFEFHFTLCAFLLYAGKYSLIGRIFRFTTSIPPKYDLLPESMDVIFSYFFTSLGWNYRDDRSLNLHYLFPGLEGMTADVGVKDAIRRYSALLFLRQYSLLR